jgi:hypothetical protein
MIAFFEEVEPPISYPEISQFDLISEAPYMEIISMGSLILVWRTY